MPKRRTQAIQVDPSKPSGALHAFAKEAAADGARSVFAAYVTADGRCEAVRMGNIEDLERVTRGLHASLVEEVGGDGG